MTRKDTMEGWIAGVILVIGLPALIFASQRMAIGFLS